jgi:hypothetical protein
MYPFDEDDELFDEDETEQEEVDIEEPVEFGIDFTTGRLTGGKVRGSKAVAVWVWNALMYPRYRYELSSFQYGCELSDMIGQVMSKEEATIMAESIIRDTLLPNPHIEDIADLKCELDDDRLSISFRLITSFGEEEIDNVAIR